MKMLGSNKLSMGMSHDRDRVEVLRLHAQWHGLWMTHMHLRLGKVIDEHLKCLLSQFKSIRNLVKFFNRDGIQHSLIVPRIRNFKQGSR